MDRECACGHEYDGSETGRRCVRPAADGHDRCPFHLDGEERRALDEPDAVLREAFCADLRSGDERRLEYVDVTLESLDLSGLLVETNGLATVRFHGSDVGLLDVSKSVFTQSLVVENCEVGRFDAGDTTFENDVSIVDSTLGRGQRGTCLTFRRATVEGALTVDGTDAEGSVEFARCTVEDWLEFDGVTVTGGAHFPNATLSRAQFVDTTFGRSVQCSGVRAERLTIERVAFTESPRFDGAMLGALRVRPAGDVECRLSGTTVESGRFDQPSAGRALYDLTDATLGDVTLDCGADTLDRYRFYRTRYDGFPFAAYRAFLRENDWALHTYAGDPETEADITGLERTYLEAKQGASAVGDHENAAAFFLREMRYRRRRYATHALDTSRSMTHRFDAALRWATSGFLDVVSGFGERPQRTAASALAVIVASAVVYPAGHGLSTGGEIVTYASHGVTALADGLYFSVVTFTTLGLGDVRPVGALGRFVAAGEALAGAFLVALFVFALGRQVTR